MKKDAREDRLGAILEPSWADLGHSDLQNRALAQGGDRFLKVSDFETDQASRGDLGRS